MDKKKFMALAALALTITGAVLYSYRMDIAMNLRQRELARQIGPNVPVNWQSGQRRRLRQSGGKTSQYRLYSGR